MQQIFVQIGETALRSPQGEPLYKVALFIKKSDADQINANAESNLRDMCSYLNAEYQQEQKKPAATLPTKTTDFTANTAPKL